MAANTKNTKGGSGTAKKKTASGGSTNKKPAATTAKKPTAKSSGSSGSGAKKTAASSSGNRTNNVGKNSGSYTAPPQRSTGLTEDTLPAIIAAVCGALLMLIAFIPGGDGSFWESVKGVYFGVFGVAGFVLPVLLFLAAGVITLGKVEKGAVARPVEAFLFSFLIGAIITIYEATPASIRTIVIADSTRAAFGRYLASGTIGPGAIGALIGSSLLKVTGSQLPSYALVGLAMIVVIMLFFGISLKKIFGFMGSMNEKRAANAVVRREERAAREEQRRIEAAERLEREKERKRLEDEERNRQILSGNAGRETGAKPENRPAAKKKPREENRPVDRSAEERSFSDEQKLIDAIVSQTEPINPGRKLRREADKPKEGQPLNIFRTGTDEEPPVVEPAEEDKAPAEEKNPDGPVIHDATGFIPKVEDANKEAAELADRLGIEDDKKKKKEKGAVEFDVPEQAPVPETYVKPTTELLTPPSPAETAMSAAELVDTGEKLINALKEYGVAAKVSDIVPGASVTRYELSPAPGVKINKFTNLSDDLAMRLAAPSGLRIEAPIPNKAAIGIEIPNKTRRTVTFREVIEDPAYADAVAKKGKLVVGLGKDIAGSGVFCNLADMPHLLVAGTTGSGKSVCLNTMIVSLIYNADPDEVKLILIDPKKVEFSVYNGLSHLIVPVVSDPRMAAGALGWAVTEMLRRYKVFDEYKVRDLKSYNKLRDADPDTDLEKLPHIVIIIDELSDLMVVAQNDVENSIMRLAQMARAAGMHLVIATQRPSVDVITGVIKANIPSKIALSVSSQIDSRTILDQGGAEKLMGHGDMLLLPLGKTKPLRLQGAFLSDDEIARVVDHVKSQGEATYSDEAEEEIRRNAADKAEAPGEGATMSDELEIKAIEFCIMNPEKASISGFQRSLGMGFAKAGRLMDTLEAKGIVGPAMGSKPRKVLITREQWFEMNNGSAASAAVPPSAETGSDD